MMLVVVVVVSVRELLVRLVVAILAPIVVVCVVVVVPVFETHPERKVEWSSQSMLGRISLPHEYKGAAVFFTSDASSFCTGTDLIIDGGHTSW